MTLVEQENWQQTCVVILEVENDAIISYTIIKQELFLYPIGEIAVLHVIFAILLIVEKLVSTK